MLDGAKQNTLRTSLGSRRAFLGWLRESSSGVLVMAVGVGAVTGVAAVGFRFLITAATRLFTGYDDYSGLGRIASAHWPVLGCWFLLLAPVAAGAIYGPIGVFAPTLFIGAMAGTAFGDIAHQILPGATESPGAYGLVGMAAALGGATRAPITAVIILFELTGEYRIILPLMAAVAMAAAVSRLLSKDTIYTRKLRRRGVDIDRPRHPFATVTAADLARPVPQPLWQTSDLATAATALERNPGGILPVLDETGRYRGCVSAREVAESLDAPEPPPTLAPLVQELSPIAADTCFHDIVIALAGHGSTGLPVVDADHTAVIGWVNHEDLLSVLHTEPER
ncbi:chloride channel protein [Nocardia sp. CA-119907]|uniref:chloride channel protein n=1 Tax=Nocardia sp. CA-119907 TaxID=3239973 RepID=UPI003D9866E3